MTTIAANREYMASDSRVTHGAICFKGQKLFRIGGAILGAAGEAGAIEKFLQWFANPAEVRMTKAEIECIEILVLERGKLRVYAAGLNPTPINSPFYAVGSGALAALGAMEMGASPKRAVAVAAKHSHGTGGQIKTMFPKT